jgi:hypothetical protein
MDRALTYIFWLSLFLIAVAYWVGTTNVINTTGQNLGSLILTSTGRNSKGQFANYPGQD